MSANQKFYESLAWKTARRATLIRDHFACVVCGRNLSGKGQSRVDHIQPVSTHPHLALNLANLRSLCPRCDNQRHYEKGGVPGQKHSIRGCDALGRPIDPKHHWAGGQCAI
jgi:5-methylcytosine-specific restriction protein A